MEIAKSIECPHKCGQVTELVKSPEGLRYNIRRHGNNELCNDRCFNCKASLGLKPKPAPAPPPKPKPPVKTDDTETVDETGTEDVNQGAQTEGKDEISTAVSDGLDDMNMAELRQHAEKLGIKTPFTTVTKEGVRKLIRNHLAAAEAETGEGGAE